LSNKQNNLQEKVLDLLLEDALKIRQLIEVQLEHLTALQCSVIEEVLDTQLFGLSKEIDFAVRAGLISRDVGRQVINRLEVEIFKFKENYYRERQLLETKTG